MGLSIGISVQRDTMADELELHVNYPLVYTNAILTKRGDQWKIVERGNRNNSASDDWRHKFFNPSHACGHHNQANDGINQTADNDAAQSDTDVGIKS